MVLHPSASLIGVAVDDGLEDGGVVLNCLSVPSVGELVVVGRDRAFQQPQQPARPAGGGAVDDAVEGPVEGREGVVGAVDETLVNGPQLLDLVLIQGVGRDSRRPAPNHAEQLVVVDDVFWGQIGHHGAAPGDQVQQPLLAEDDQCFSNGAPADIERGGQSLLVDLGPRLQRTGEDLLPDVEHYLVGQSAPPPSRRAGALVGVTEYGQFGHVADDPR